MGPAHIGLTCPAGWPSGPSTSSLRAAGSSPRPPDLPCACLPVLGSDLGRASPPWLPTERQRRASALHWRPGCPCRGAELSIPCSLTLARLLMDGRININGALLWSGLFCPVRQFTRVNGSIDPDTVAISSSQQADEGDEASYSKRQRRGCAAQRCPASARTRPAGDGRDRSSRTRLAPKSKLLLAYLAW